MSQPLFTKRRLLLHALLLSLCLNVALLILFFYFLIKDNPLHFAYKPQSQKLHLQSTIDPCFLAKLQNLSFKQLQSHLSDKRPVEGGLCMRDLALSLLIEQHHLDIQSALSRKQIGTPVALQVGDDSCLRLYPHLNEEDFVAIETYMHQTTWPLTTRGLFLQIQQQGTESEPSLLQSFCQSEEFLLMQTMAARTDLDLSRNQLLSLLCSGTYEQLEKVCQNLAETGGFEQELLSLYDYNRRPKVLRRPPAAPAPHTHLVQPGESLWLIARKYNVSIEELMQLNGLQSTTLQPGQDLRVPDRGRPCTMDRT